MLKQIFFVICLTLLCAVSYSELIGDSDNDDTCQDDCRFSIVESIPENLTYAGSNVTHGSTYHAWMTLMMGAKKSLDLGSFYWSLLANETGGEFPSDWQGRNSYKMLQQIGAKIKVRIAENAQEGGQPETLKLMNEGLALVRSLNFTRWFGSGILHTKMWVADNTDFYVGSANMDWRSLTQVKELGAYVRNCSCLANEVSKIFSVYWHMGIPGTIIPPKWPTSLSTKFNAKNPMNVSLNNMPYHAYVSSSPPPLSAKGREQDIDAVLHTINNAMHFVHIAVMDYSPTTLYNWPKQYWPVIDDAIRRAAFERHVKVKLLMSNWAHTKHAMYSFLRSLTAINGGIYHKHGDNTTYIQVKLFKVPSTPEQEEIPFARVNHNKYMVTETTAYIGTSNWSGDYFTTTGGVALVISNKDAVDYEGQSPAEQLRDIFDRDWYSEYSKDLY